MRLLTPAPEDCARPTQAGAVTSGAVVAFSSCSSRHARLEAQTARVAPLGASGVSWTTHVFV